MTNANQELINIDLINDEDFDFLCDSTLDIVHDLIPFIDDEPSTLNKVSERLNSDSYEINVEVNTPTFAWWQDNDQDGELNEEQDEALKKVTLELNLTSTTISGSHANEKVVVASVLIDVDESMQDLKNKPISNIRIKWLPELDN